MSAFAQGSIFGTVQNSNLNNPAVGDLYWFGFLDDTDEEIRIESNTGAGYDGVNWFDDFQNYSTEVAGNPYDHYFINIANNEAYHLSGPIPSNSFQQQNILLAPSSFPVRPSNIVASAVSTGRINITWTSQPGVTYHVYRRVTANNGVFRRIDDPTGNLANQGVADSFYVNTTSDGVSNYTFILIAENASGNFSAHSLEVSTLASTIVSPTLVAVIPDSGSATGQPTVTVRGTNFDVGGMTVTFGGNPATNVVVLSPFELTCTVPLGTPGTQVDVVATNTTSGLSSSALVNGFRYLGNSSPLLAVPGAQSVDEGQNLNFAVTATDPDGDSLILSALNVPANATFIDDFNGSGTFDFNPDFSQAGPYTVTFIASDGTLADTATVDITVNQINQSPVLTPIGAQVVTEGQNLNIGITASDLDGDSLILSAEGVPTNAIFTDNFNGTGTFDFNPDFLQSGSYDVTFIASDGTLADTEIVTITVNEAGNQAPQLTAIVPQSVNEGQNLNFGVSAIDAEGDSIIITAPNAPLNAILTDNGNGTATFDFNPDFTQAGVYNVEIVASDGSLADTEIVVITVNDAGNQFPAWTPIGPQVVTEGQNLNLAVSATDPDADSLILTAENLPANATFFDNGDNTGTFDFSPDFLQSGVYNVTFIVSDGILADTEIVAVTVNDAGNQRPVLDPIADTSVDENVNLAFGISASDPDNDSLILTVPNPPANSTFIDSGNGAGSFSFTPDFTQAGVFIVFFIASDGVLSDTATVTITVFNANEPPTLSPIGPQVIDEGQILLLSIAAVDPEGDSVTLSAANTPPGATFVDSGNGMGSFDWTPNFTQSGVYNVTFVASDSVLADTEIVTITVNEGGNQKPILDPIGPQAVNEGQPLLILTNATDPDGSTPAYTFENVPAGAVVTDSGDGTASLEWTPTYFDSGTYNVRFIVSDGLLADSEVVALTVNDVDRAPILATIGPKSVLEGDSLAFLLTAADADSHVVTLRAESVPVNATFVDSGAGRGSFRFQPNFTQAGVYNVRFIAEANALADTELVAISVNEAGNQRPVLDSIGPKMVNEFDTLSFRWTASDADGTIPIMSVVNLPANATYIDSANGHASFRFNPNNTQVGVYQVSFIASDGILADTEIVSVTVTDLGNLPPVFDSIPVPVLVDEGDTLILVVHATDPEGGPVHLGVTKLFKNSTFVDSGNGIGVFTYRPSYIQARIDTMRFVAIDDNVPAGSKTYRIPIHTVDVNRPPILDSIGTRLVLALDSLKFRITAKDTTAPAGTQNELSYVAYNLPANADFADSGNGAAGFEFRPTFDQIGTYQVTFVVSDDGTPSLADQEVVTIEVLQSNRAPILAFIGPKVVAEGDTLSFRVSATDADSTIPMLRADSLPVNATFVDSGNGAGSLTYMPDYTQAGLHEVIIVAYDGIAQDKEQIIVQTLEAGNQRPQIAFIGPQQVIETNTLTIVVNATDPDSTIPVITVDTLIENATFVDSGNGLAVYEITPWYDQDSVYLVRFFASDGTLADTENVFITVVDIGNQVPVLAPIPAQTPKLESDPVDFLIVLSAIDIDSTIPILETSALPGASQFQDNGDGTGVFIWDPGYNDEGTYAVVFRAIDAEFPSDYDSQIVILQVNDKNRLPILQIQGGLPQVGQGDSVILTASAFDPDGETPELGISNLLPGVTSVNDLGNGNAQLVFAPNFSTVPQVYFFNWVATDGRYDSVQVSQNQGVQVLAVNLPPEIDTVGLSPQSVLEGDSLAFIVTATDPNGFQPIMNVITALPSGAAFTPSPGMGVFSWRTNYMQSGTYLVRITASDGPNRDTADVTISVLEAGNQPPQFILVPPDVDTVVYQTSLQQHLFARDLDDPNPTITAESMPPNASFFDSGNGGAFFVFTPDSSQIDGSFPVRFIVSDGVAADTALATFDVIWFVRGDCNFDGIINILDVTYLIDYVFRFGPDPIPVVQAGDVNADGVVNVLDVTYLIDYVFRFGPPPPP